MMKLDLIEIERARDDIRRGMPVIMASNDDKILVFSAEDFSTTQEHLIEKIGVQSFDVVLTTQRAAYVPLPKNDNVITFKLDAHTHFSNQIHHIIGLINEQTELESIAHHTKEATKLQKETLTFIKLTELLPAVITLRLDNITDETLSHIFEAPLMMIHAEKVREYYTKRFTTIKRVCKAPLTLKNAPDAAIYGYRPDIGGSEHYAIIVGTPFNDEAPLVRLHSSCYTGDLLASMRCDCGDQLQEALSLMNEYYQKPNEHHFSGGIILYIMQEGRGIGLTNKLRTYDLQSKGHDTVEANRKLGFEDDERQFIQAASILRDLNIESVHLLSNNPRKSRILDELGIHVKDTVSHFVESNEHNRDYLKTKEERLGHTF